MALVLKGGLFFDFHRASVLAQGSESRFQGFGFRPRLSVFSRADHWVFTNCRWKKAPKVLAKSRVFLRCMGYVTPANRFARKHRASHLWHHLGSSPCFFLAVLNR